MVGGSAWAALIDWLFPCSELALRMWDLVHMCGRRRGLGAGYGRAPKRIIWLSLSYGHTLSIESMA